jgi:hypothetical protein
MITRVRSTSQLLQSTFLLITESKNDLDQIRKELSAEMKPRRFIEHMYVDEMGYHIWEILRYRRGKTNLIRLAMRPALEDLLPELLRQSGEYAHHHRDEAQRLAQDWFSNEKTKKHVRELLARYGLDDSAIEAQAMRRVADELDWFDRLLASAEGRRERALRGITEYRFARQLRESSDRMINRKALEIEYSTDKKPSVAA